MKNKNSIKLNFVWQLCIEVTNMMLPLVTSPIIARRLGAESIGIYSYVYSISYYFIIFSSLGIFQYGTREIAAVRGNKKEFNRVFNELLGAQLIVGIVVLFSYILYSIFFSKYKLMFFIQTISLLGSSTILINWLFTGLEKFRFIALKTVVIRIVGVVFIVAFVKDTSDLVLYTLIMALEPVLSSLTYIIDAPKYVHIERILIKNSIKHIKGMCLLFVPLLTTYLYSSIDKIMLGRISSMTELGYYENATKALIARNLATALSTVLVPRMANLIGEKKNKMFNDLLNKSLNIVLFLNIIFGFGTAAIAHRFSLVFWGDKFAPCGKLILTMSLTLPAYGLTYVINNQCLVPLKKERVYILSTLAGAFINYFLNLLLIEKYHALGASIATLLTQYIVLIIELVVIHKQLSISIILKNNLIYVMFGLIMFIAIKTYENLYVTDSIITLFLEIIIGMILICIMLGIYWIYKKDQIYLPVIKGFVINIREFFKR